jgi:hypothetical protein
MNYRGYEITIKSDGSHVNWNIDKEGVPIHSRWCKMNEDQALREAQEIVDDYIAKNDDPLESDFLQSQLVESEAKLSVAKRTINKLEAEKLEAVKRAARLAAELCALRDNAYVLCSRWTGINQYSVESCSDELRDLLDRTSDEMLSGSSL